MVGDKIQGQTVDIKMEEGDIDIESLYAVQAHLRCSHGDINIGSSHGSTSASTKQGNITARKSRLYF